MRRIGLLIVIGLILAGTVMTVCTEQKFGTAAWQPKRLNKAIELWEAGQPVYYKGVYGGYEEGRKHAKTWADILLYNMEHKPVNFTLLREFMQGLVDAGPTPSGHRTPAVVVLVPALGTDAETFKGGSWMIQQALAQGAHGIHLCRARDPEAVKRFVQNARYPVHKQGIDVLGEGVRGWGSHIYASQIWGLTREEYLQKADVWPLNPDGEIILGIKLEDPHALKNAALSTAVPGIAFAEHGPRDFGLSMGYLEGRADPPVPDEVNAAGDYVLSLCDKYGLAFLDNVLPDNVSKQIDRGVDIGAGSVHEAAIKGRKHTKRKMPW